MQTEIDKERGREMETKRDRQIYGYIQRDGDRDRQRDEC